MVVRSTVCFSRREKTCETLPSSKARQCSWICEPGSVDCGREPDKAIYKPSRGRSVGLCVTANLSQKPLHDVSFPAYLLLLPVSRFRDQEECPLMNTVRLSHLIISFYSDRENIKPSNLSPQDFIHKSLTADATP